jgi:cellobiose phosphorylase
MRLGYFDDLRREYVITTPKTPVKWINYIGTLAFGGFVDQTGGVLLCKGDPALNRITKYISQLPAYEFKGETIYLRLKKPEGYQVFSPFYVPTLDSYDRFECHIGLGYTRIISEFYGIRTEVVILVPPSAACEIRDIHFTNISTDPIELDAIPLVEYTHFDALKQLTNADWVPQTMQSRAMHQAEEGLVLLQYAFMHRDTAVNYFTSNLPVSSFDTVRSVFLGGYEYGTWSHPLALQQSELANSLAQRGDNIAALMHHIGILQPGETRRLITQLGQASPTMITQENLDIYRQPENVDAALADLASFWQSYLSRLQVHTPDESMNHMLNIHNPRQCYITMNWSRYLSLYQLGYGERGIGFRDSSQDVMGIFPNAPEEGKKLIRMLLNTQRRNGSALHQFNPLTMDATAGDSRESPDAPQYYSDDALWIILAITAYLKETGDFAYLDENIPFYEKDDRGNPLEGGSVMEHMNRAIKFTSQDLGVHDLPLLGYADWNDTVNLRKGAESFFTANLYGKALLEMIALYQHLEDPSGVQKTMEFYSRMRDSFNQHGWDGQWFLRYFDWDGSPLGSHHNDQGQIFLNGQSWAVISGFAPHDKARQAMDSVFARLNTRNGIKLSAPGFDGFCPTKGGVSTYPPGAKENGGIFLHANPWAMIAEAMLGNGDRAYTYYAQINPGAKNDRIEEYECEPYVYAQNILGDEHPQFGLARNSWLTGTASWVYQAATMYILGIKPTYRGLWVNPCIPAEWPGYTLRRYFRDAWYEIQVENPQHVHGGIKSIEADGQAIYDQIVPIYADGGTHRIVVTLGHSIF